MSTCDHSSATPVLNASGEPVRLICLCGREWRVLPIELKVLVTPP